MPRPVLSTLDAAAPIRLSGVLSHTVGAGGTVHNFNPTGLSAVSVVRLDGFSGSLTITGMAGGAAGRVVYFVHADTSVSFTVTFNDDDANSTAANRFDIASSGSFLLRSGKAIGFWYDTTDSRWRILTAPLDETMVSGDEIISGDWLYAYGDVVLAGVVSPAQITADQNNYDPGPGVQWSSARLSSDASRNITGLLAVGDFGEYKLLHNVGANPIVLKDESASSTATNRFAFSGGDLTLAADESVTLLYDNVTDRWRAVGVGRVSSGGGAHTHDEDDLVPDTVEVDENIGLGETGLVQSCYYRKYVTDEAVSVGSVLKLSSTTDGRVVKTTANTDYVVGVSLDAAGAAGATVRVAFLGVCQVLVESAQGAVRGTNNLTPGSTTAGHAFTAGALNFDGPRSYIGTPLETSASGSNRLVWVDVHIVRVASLTNPLVIEDVAAAEAIGTAASAARSDHVHAHGTGYAGGHSDYPVAGTTPVQIDIGDAQAGGSATTWAKNDHQHALPAPATGYPVDIAATEADGSATTVARADHRHAHGSGYAGGHSDYPAVASAAEVANVAAAEADGSSARYARADHVHAHGTGYAGGHSDSVLKTDTFSVQALWKTPTAADDVLVWIAPFACTVTAIKGYQDTGTGSTVNAFKGSLASPTTFRSANLTVNAADTVVDGGAVQNTSVAAGDKVYMRLAGVSGSPNEVLVELYLTRV